MPDGAKKEQDQEQRWGPGKQEVGMASLELE